jgi:hypothetical protein
MPDSPNLSDGIVGEFRRKIGDTVYNFAQFTFQCKDPVSSVALVEISDNNLLTDITAGSAAELNIDLSDPAVDTIEKLVAHINAQSQYRAALLADGDALHPSTDLEIIPPKDCLRKDVQLKTRRWGDAELLLFLQEALSTHSRNTGLQMDITHYPSSHKDFILLLAQVAMYWDQINNATKRRGLDLRVDDFRSLHEALLSQYERMIAAWKAQLETTTTDPTLVEGAGDVILGTQYRRNLRTGRLSPSAVSPYPTASTIIGIDIGGGKVRLDWGRSRIANFSHYEVWRDTVDAVSNISEIARPSGAVPSTSVKVRKEYDIERILWIDGGTAPLPPGTYYYRLYVYNHNGEWASSDVISVVVV